MWKETKMIEKILADTFFYSETELYNYSNKQLHTILKYWLSIDLKEKSEKINNNK